MIKRLTKLAKPIFTRSFCSTEPLIEILEDTIDEQENPSHKKYRYIFTEKTFALFLEQPLFPFSKSRIQLTE
jgi:hypothetical protein